MSKKISDFFKFQQLNHETEVKQEKEVNFTISFDELEIKPSKVKIEENIKIVKNSNKEVPTNINENRSKICKFCGKESTSANNLREHLKRLHPENFKDLLNCSICNLKFTNENALDSHVRKKHPDGQFQQFECDFDGKIFKTKQDLRSHMRIHRSWIKCEICHKIFSFCSIQNHRKSVHLVRNNYKCKICLKNFKTPAILSKHEKTHNKEIECKICKKMFSTTGRLKDHVKDYHENPRSHKCEICEKTFMQKSHLNNHQKVHDKSRKKLLKCQKCDYATEGPSKLKDHEKIHDRQEQKLAAMKNPLKCKNCPKFFQNNHSLRQHIRKVHSEISVQCDLCAKYIKFKSNLVNHMKIHTLND